MWLAQAAFVANICPMDVITSHLSADFDAFGSMVAAKKLYPEAVLAFPGSQEKSLRDFFMESTLYILSIERAKDIDLDAVKRLILVDTRQKSRIGRFAEIAESDGVEVHVYDHHPDSEDDVHGDVEIVEEVGATVTILSRLLRERRIHVNSEEATVLALGVYEDTGSFTFSSTTPEDLRAAAWLVEQGANLNLVSDMMTGDMTRDQIEVLHQLIEGMEYLMLGGLDVLVSTASVNGYVGDLAVLVHRLRDMENPDAVFTLVRMDDRVHLICRSRADEVNAGEIAAEFGGGGHPTAASATIRELSLYQAKEQLVHMLHQRVRAKNTAGDVMSKPAITVAEDESLGAALEVLGRYRISSLPVVSDSHVVGILNRTAAENAAHHGLQDAPVSDYMDHEVDSVGPDDPIESALRISMDGMQRLVPVSRDGSIVGVITRTDILEHMRLPTRKDSAAPEEYPGGRPRIKNVKRVMEELLPDRVMEILRQAGETAAYGDEEVYLVGGAVRDLMLRKRNLDIDLVVEGTGIPFARELAECLGGCRVKTHEKFGTAKLLFTDGLTVDIATARHEYYDSPGALPEVEMSSIKRDLFRRDFTINTLAVALNPKAFGRLIDFFGGTRDLKERVIRVLHNLAFVEDPTRILRALRFANRFDFSVGKHTHSLMKSAIKINVFERVEGRRLLNELVRILEEQNPVGAVGLMDEYKILPIIFPGIDYSYRTRELLESSRGVLDWWRFQFLDEDLEKWIVHFLALTDSLGQREFEYAVERLGMAPHTALKLFRERRNAPGVLAEFGRGLVDRASRAVELLRPFSHEMLLYMMAKTGRDETRKAVSEYITRLRHVKPELTGSDLIDMGYEPGPQFHEILEQLRNARLDGMISSTDREIDFVREHFPLEAYQP